MAQTCAAWREERTLSLQMVASPPKPEPASVVLMSIHVCMCACECVCACECMCACKCVCACECMCACECVCM